MSESSARREKRQPIPSGSAGTAPPPPRFPVRVFLFSLGGVGLSAAARSAAALVYDKLTPNCHLLNLIWKKADINYGACLYMCIEFSIISKRAVQRIVPLPNARFPVVYRSPADTEFGTDFRLPHAVHIAIQDGKFQSG